MRKLSLAFIFMMFLATPAFAGLNVVATLPWIGSLARELGKDKVSVTTLVKPNQDPHMVEAKPSMILAGRKADIIMYNGLDLEIGYLPLILESSRNPKIAPGKPGNFDCSRFVKAIGRHAAVDRSMGDVHPLGDPHYHFSPANVLRVAQGMSEALAALDRTNAAIYRANYQSFAAKWNDKEKQWQKVNLKGKQFVAYHKLFDYLAADFGFRIVGYIESKPGIPPSAAHVEELVQQMKASRPDAILTTGYFGKKESDSVSAQTGVKVVSLPADVGAMRGTEDWFSFMDTVLELLR